MPDSRPSSRGGRPDSKGGKRSPPRTPRPESAPEPPPPLPTHPLTFSFSFELVPHPVAEPTPPAEGEEPPPPPKPPLEGTYFVLTLPELNETGATPRNTEHVMKHSLSDAEGGSEEACTVEVTVSHIFVRWLVEEAQGALPLTLRKTGVDGAADSTVALLPLDLCSIIFGKQRATARWEADAASAPASARLGSSSLEGVASAMPAGMAELARSCAVTVDTDVPLLSEELLSGLNPMSVTLMRADSMPPSYSGTPFKRPYEELSERCAPVHVSWSLLGASHTCAERPHAKAIVWNERHLLLAGARVIPPKDLERQLREVGLTLELHDRDPAPEPVVLEAEGGGEEGVEAPAAAPGAAAEGAEGGEAGGPAAAALGDEEVKSAQHPPFGVASKRLGEIIPRRPTDSAAYAQGGIPVRTARRFVFELEVFPCERPKMRPEPEETAAEYYPGAYVESCTELTVDLELAAPLNPERPPRPAAELQRIVTLIRYNDTPTLLGLLNVVKAANDAIGMNSASAWESYKEERREDLDLVTGVQLVDGETRLFVYEGQPASFEPLNAMGRLMKMLERKQPNSNTAFTLMNSSITFPARLYNSFEMPTKLIKLRAPLPQLLLRPDVYQYLRVAEGCRDALLCLGALLHSTTLRYAFKAAAFPYAAHLLQLEKKFGGVQLVVDREGVVDDDDDDMDGEYYGYTGAPSGARARSGHRGNRRSHTPRKAATDCQNANWLASLRERATLPVINWLARNIAELPVAPPPAPLPDWYLASIPQPKGPVYMYSGQRLNQTEIQKETLRTTLADLHKKGQHMSYNRDFLWADSIGDREERVGYVRPDADLAPWDSRAPPVYNKDGTRSSFRLLQPSHYRTEELSMPWDEEALMASRKPLSRGAAPADAEGKPRPRFDPNPKAPGFLEKELEGYRSIFQQTEEGMAAERAERVEGAIGVWTKKLVIDDPVMRVDLRTRDRGLQTEKCLSILKDAPTKRALKSLYRGKKPLTLSQEPSAFMGEPTVDMSLRSRGEGLRATWTTQKWPQP